MAQGEMRGIMNKRQKKKLKNRLDFASANGYGITYRDRKYVERAYREHEVEFRRVKGR